jgi:hypothetical protein
MMMKEEFVDSKPTRGSHGPVVWVYSDSPRFLSETGVKADAGKIKEKKQNDDILPN